MYNKRRHQCVIAVRDKHRQKIKDFLLQRARCELKFNNSFNVLLLICGTRQ